MKKCANVFLGLVVCLIFAGSVRAEAIYHEKFYPDGSGPFPAVIALHTSGGFKTVKHLIQRYVDDGFDPPPLNGSTHIFKEGGSIYGNQATQAGRDCHQVTPD